MTQHDTHAIPPGENLPTTDLTVSTRRRLVYLGDTWMTTGKATEQAAAFRRAADHKDTPPSLASLWRTTADALESAITEIHRDLDTTPTPAL